MTLKESINTDNFASDFANTNVKNINMIDAEALNLNTNQSYDTTYEYNFGINSINIFNKQPLTVSGYISPEVKIKNSNFITVSVSQTNPEVSQEYYIIDNNKEYPIQPKELQQVIKEKIFFNLPIRFPIDESKEVTIYKNNIKTDLTYSQLQSINSDDEYTITYTPKQEAFRYKPNSNILKVKVIQRHLGTEVPSAIKTISIVCHGGSAIWNI